MGDHGLRGVIGGGNHAVVAKASAEHAIPAFALQGFYASLEGIGGYLGRRHNDAFLDRLR